MEGSDFLDVNLEGIRNENTQSHSISLFGLFDLFDLFCLSGGGEEFPCDSGS